jgi:hypothetical protein
MNAWTGPVETPTEEPCPDCGHPLEIIEDCIYFIDDDGVKPGYCAACEGCGNAWAWKRTPAEALAAVPDAADWKKYDHTDYQAQADYYDGVSRGQHD